MGDDPGVIDRFDGDKIFASWGTLAPMGSSKSKTAAAAAALKIQKAVAEGTDEEYAMEEPLATDYEIKIGIGIAHGSVLCGNMGCDSLKGFSVIGHTVNLGYTIEKLNKY